MRGVADDAEDCCPICLNILYCVFTTACGHTYCKACWEKLEATATSEARTTSCPTCREKTSAVRDHAREVIVRERQPEGWRLQHLAAVRDARCREQAIAIADADAAKAAAAALETMEEEAVLDEHGRLKSRRMTAGLLRRYAKEQSPYRTLTLIPKLELTLCGLRDVSPALGEYSMLTALRLEHNVLVRLAPLDLPLLRVLSVHHNRLEFLGDDLLGVPALLQLDAGHNQLRSLDGLKHTPKLTSLVAPSNLLSSAAALVPLCGCAGALSTLELQSNQLPSIEALQPLASLPELRAIRLSGNPLSASHSRAAILSCMPTVRVLDGVTNAAHAQRAARQSALDKGQRAMMELKRRGEQKRIATYGEGSLLMATRLDAPRGNEEGATKAQESKVAGDAAGSREGDGAPAEARDAACDPTPVSSSSTTSDHAANAASSVIAIGLEEEMDEANCAREAFDRQWQALVDQGLAVRTERTKDSDPERSPRSDRGALEPSIANARAHTSPAITGSPAAAGPAEPTTAAAMEELEHVPVPVLSPSSAHTQPAAGLYTVQWLPDVRRDTDTDWRLGRWTRRADLCVYIASTSKPWRATCERRSATLHARPSGEVTSIGFPHRSCSPRSKFDCAGH
jgi:hypothetical protein